MLTCTPTNGITKGQPDSTTIYTKSSLTDVIAAHDNVPKGFALLQNYPNPFNPSTMIKYDISKPARVRLDIYNALGQSVKSVDEGMQAPGEYNNFFNGSNLPSGVYFYRLTAVGTDGKSLTDTKKMLELK